MGGASSTVNLANIKLTEQECKSALKQLFDKQLFNAYADTDNMVSLESLQKVFELRTDIFLTHDWGKELGIDNHERVARMNEALKKRGLRTWFDSEKMEGNVKKKMIQGIENANCIVVFITKRYMDKVDSDNAEDNCQLEFNYASRRKTAKRMVPVVMEERMRAPSDWIGEVGMVLGGSLFVDFSTEESFEARMDELFYRVLGVTGVTVQQMVDDPVWQSLIQSKLQHASDLVPGQLAAMSISNGDSSPPPLSSSPAKAGGGVHEQEQQMLAALRDWILNNTSVVPKFASQYAQQLMDGGVGSVEKLAKKLTRKATYLLDLGLDEDDAEEIALAVKKGGSSATAGTTAVRAERDFGDLYRIYLQCRILGNRTKDDLVNIAMDAQDPDKARMAKALLTLAYFGGGGDFKVDMDLCHHYGNQVLSWLKENSLPPTDDLLASGDVEAAPFSTRIMATTILAYMHRDGILVGKDDIMSLRLTKAAFPYGFQLTQFLLAYAYDAGRGVVADPKKAVQYYRMAAAQNHPTALLNIGLCYVRGEGVEQDFREAIRLFKLAGEQGYSRAICEIGEIHYFGRGTAVSYESAIPFFQQAHDLGYDRASYMLGWCYLHGQGVGVDRDRGIEFLRTAVSRGNEDAQNALNSL